MFPSDGLAPANLGQTGYDDSGANRQKFFSSFFQKRTASFLIVLIRSYQLLIRPLLAPSCRFEPSCSSYAIEALREHGAVRGSAMAAWRVARCNPWGGCGYDPVPTCTHRRETFQTCTHERDEFKAS